MPKVDLDVFLDDESFVPAATKRIERKSRRLSQREKRIRQQAEQMAQAAKAQLDVQPQFNPSFKPAMHERAWLLNYLEGAYKAKVISDILGKVKGGKEANVYICAAHPDTGLDLIAAKVYRPRMFRNLRNDARYRQGRILKDEEGKDVFGGREARAMEKKTRFGNELRQLSWLEAEFETMQVLYEAGASVPKPYMHSSNVILMEYVGAETSAAPTLNTVTLSADEAPPLFARLVEDLRILLACHRVHADFSAYNVLYWEGQVKIIDFPQAVDPRRNPDAFDLFRRDVARLCQYFARYHIAADAPALADELWSTFERTNTLDANAVPVLEDIEGM